MSVYRRGPPPNLTKPPPKTGSKAPPFARSKGILPHHRVGGPLGGMGSCVHRQGPACRWGFGRSTRSWSASRSKTVAHSRRTPARVPLPWCCKRLSPLPVHLHVPVHCIGLRCSMPVLSAASRILVAASWRGLSGPIPTMGCTMITVSYLIFEN